MVPHIEWLPTDPPRPAPLLMTAIEAATYLRLTEESRDPGGRSQVTRVHGACARSAPVPHRTIQPLLPNRTGPVHRGPDRAVCRRRVRPRSGCENGGFKRSSRPNGGTVPGRPRRDGILMIWHEPGVLARHSRMSALVFLFCDVFPHGKMTETGKRAGLVLRKVPTVALLHAL
jgi:hypothetical protein